MNGFALRPASPRFYHTKREWTDTFVDGKKHTTWRVWNEDQSGLILKYEYVDDKHHGVQAEWHYNGRLKEIRRSGSGRSRLVVYLKRLFSCHEDRQYGLNITWDEDGNITRISDYHDDLLRTTSAAGATSSPD